MVVVVTKTLTRFLGYFEGLICFYLVPAIACDSQYCTDHVYCPVLQWIP